MTPRMYITTTGMLFALIAVAHFIRLILSWPVNVDQVSIPLWVSALAVLLAGYLMYSAYKLNQRQ